MYILELINKIQFKTTLDIICDTFTYSEPNFVSPKYVMGDEANKNVETRLKRITEWRDKYKTKLSNFDINHGL